MSITTTKRWRVTFERWFLSPACSSHDEGWDYEDWTEELTDDELAKARASEGRYVKITKVEAIE